MPSLAEAVALVPRLRSRAAGPVPVVIELAGGMHRIARPVRIDAAAGGRPGASLTLRGAPDGSTRLLGSVPLARVEAPPPPGAPEAARGRIRSYRLPDEAAARPSIAVHRTHRAPAPPIGLELFDARGALAPARWPNEGWARLRLPGPAARDGIAADPAIRVEGDRSDRWLDETDLWVEGYIGQDWSFETIPAVAAVKGSGRVALAAAPLYPLRADDRYAVVHALAELDRPGEWWREPGTGLVHLIPRAGADEAVEVSLAESLIALEGASHVLIEGLTLERTRGDAVIVRGGADVVVQDCTIRWTGGRGLVIEDAVRSGLRRSLVADTGEGGAALSGGDRAGLVPARNFVEDSVIVRFARLGRTYKDAVGVDGVGMRVVGNVLAHAPHLAIRYQGNDHEIALNEIFDVVNDTSDAAAIYTGRDVAAQGTVLRGNFLHDVEPAPGFEVKGIYLDDMASGTTIENNLFLRVQQPVFVGGGRDNAVVGNLFARASPALYLDGRGKSWPGPPPDSPHSDIRVALDAVPVAGPVWSARYPRLSRLMRDDPLAAKRNAFRDNVLVASAGPVIERGAERREQMIAGNRSADEAKADEAALRRLTAEARSAAALAPILAILGTGATARMPLDRMDRVAILGTIPALARRAGGELKPVQER